MLKQSALSSTADGVFYLRGPNFLALVAFEIQFNAELARRLLESLAHLLLSTGNHQFTCEELYYVALNAISHEERTLEWFSVEHLTVGGGRHR